MTLRKRSAAVQTAALLGMIAALIAAAPAHAQKMAAKRDMRHRAKIVAYDVKDRKYYSVAYAKAHGMHDRGGDKLILIPRAKLPKGAKLSHAMQGVEP